MGSLRDRSAFPPVGQDYPKQQGLGAHLPNIDVKRYPRLLKKYTEMQTWPPQSITQRAQAGPMRGSCYCRAMGQLACPVFQLTGLKLHEISYFQFMMQTCFGMSDHYHGTPRSRNLAFRELSGSHATGMASCMRVYLAGPGDSSHVTAMLTMVQL